MTGGGVLDARLKTMAAKLGGRRELHVGFLAGGQEADGTSLPMVAFIQEYGAPRAGIPPRPYFRRMIAKHKAEWPAQVAKLVKARDYDAAAALEGMGEVISEELRASIAALVSPPLSTTTLMIRKMLKNDPTLRFRMSYKTVIEARARVAAGKSYAGVSTKPLIDSGLMLNGVGHEVEDSP
jgi:hypothetical protein